MYQPAEAHPGLSQASKINIFRLMLQTIFAKSTIMDV